MKLPNRWFVTLVSGCLLTAPVKANSLAEAMGAYNAEDFATAVQMLVPLVKTYGDKATRSVLLMVYRRWQGSPTCTPDMIGQVQSVTDGDTLKLKYGDGKLVTVRLFAADAPETKQAFGDVAKKRLNVLVGGKEICVQPNGEDRYHRQLGIVWTSSPECDKSNCPKVLDAGMTLIAEGLAWRYLPGQSKQPVELSDRYDLVQSDAVTRRVGVWSDESPVSPWDWRKRIKNAAGANQ